MPRIVVIEGRDAGVTVEIGDKPLSVGRHESRDIALDDDMASRLHATIERRGGKTTVRDLGSTNGTLVNGVPITETVLRNGDCILIGNTRLQYVDESEEAAEAPKKPAEEPAEKLVEDSLASTLILQPRGKGAKATAIQETHALPTSCDVASIVREAVESAQPLAQLRGAQMQFDSPQLVVEVDGNVFYRVVASLLGLCLESSAVSGRLTLRLLLEAGKGLRLAGESGSPEALRRHLAGAMGENRIADSLAALESVQGKLEISPPQEPGERIFTIVVSLRN